MSSFKCLRGFSLIELLVVITIVTLLVSLLLPALNNSRDLGTVLACQARQRGLFMAFNAYAADFAELPCAYPIGTTINANVALDNAGYITGWTSGPYVFNGATYVGNTYSVQTAEMPKWYNTNYFDPTSTLAHVVSQNYIPDPRIFQCNTLVKASFIGGYSRGYNCYNFNGPNTWGPGIGNNGQWNALNVLGKHTGGSVTSPDWGVRYRDDPVVIGNTRRARSDVAMFVCPTLYAGTATNRIIIEPHGLNVSYSVGGYLQFDGGPMSATAPLNRNVLFADGHDTHASNTTHAIGLP